LLAFLEKVVSGPLQSASDLKKPIKMGKWTKIATKSIQSHNAALLLLLKEILHVTLRSHRHQNVLNLLEAADRSGAFYTKKTLFSFAVSCGSG
jgi:hypothetical protein